MGRPKGTVGRAITEEQFQSITLMLENGKKWGGTEGINAFYKQKNNALYKAYRRMREAVVRGSQVKLTPVEKVRKNGKGLLQAPRAIYTDTRSMSWTAWAKKFCQVDLLPHQLEDIEAIERESRLILNDPRRHGKTYIVEFIFSLRKLCENQFHEKDQPIIFISAVAAVCENFCLAIRHELEENPTIRDNYGILVDDSAKNTSMIINIYRRERTFHSFIALRTGGRARGLGARWVIIDDPVDIFSESEKVKVTIKTLMWLRQKIIPIAKGGSIALVGTRYDIADIYIQINITGTRTVIKRQAIIKWGKYTIPQGALSPDKIIVEGDWELLAPELFTNLANCPEAGPVQNLLFLLIDMGQRAFNQEMQNDPLALNPDINLNWFHFIKDLPSRPEDFRWIAFMDVGTSEEEGDYTAIALMGFYNKNYYLVDSLHGRFSMSKKMEIVEQTITVWRKRYNSSIRFYVEVVGAQKEAYQWLRDKTTTNPKEFNPQKERGDKKLRIMNNLGLGAEEGMLYVLESMANFEQFKQEISSFPHYEHDDLIDAVDECFYLLKKKAKPIGLTM
jgi:predicted phage terminase large subunit-like protein